MNNKEINLEILSDEFYEQLLEELKSKIKDGGDIRPDNFEMTDEEFYIFVIEDYLQSRHKKRKKR